ncbi:GUN4 domain-containing protein [Tolypothrix sp. VBCCA 56010]|uniref:GUN4 domain-containing protein n=1 Tax=Tolypothrix sp. VBCCA 56010 TaxID=3137731 RepID=UPI003D7F0827
MNSNTPAKKILILAANPKQTSRLRLDEEVRDIKEGLRLSQQRDKFILQQEWAVRPRDVRRAVLDFRPNIIHFSGHGAGTTGLSFEDETGKEKLVTSVALAGLFGQFAKQVECVVLNACYSEEQALAIAQHIDYVIGMNAAIGDKAALEFAVGFYDALVAYDPRYDTYSRIEFAFNIACNAIQFAGISGDSIPIMKKKPHLGKVEEQPANPQEESQLSNGTVSANQNQASRITQQQNTNLIDEDLAAIEARIPQKEFTLNNQEPPQLTSIHAEPNNAQPSTSNFRSLFAKIAQAKNKLLAGSAIFLIGLAGFQIYEQKFSNPRYTQLESLLSQQRWQDADVETAQRMWEVAGKWNERSLKAEDYQKFPCEDLRTIDSLWTKYSNHHFGFSVQRSIWESSEVNGRLGKFMIRVGWGEEKENGKNGRVPVFVFVTNFSLSAPKGQLPWVVNWQGSGDREAYMSRIISCGL